ncbi:MAG: hypothetical protein AB7P03_25730 [Kofleriaceae bacterium]
MVRIAGSTLSTVVGLTGLVGIVVVATAKLHAWSTTDLADEPAARPQALGSRSNVALRRRCVPAPTFDAVPWLSARSSPSPEAASRRFPTQADLPTNEYLPGNHIVEAGVLRFRECWRADPRMPYDAGTQFLLTINGEGRVAEAVFSQLGCRLDGDVARCLTAAARELRFPPAVRATPADRRPVPGLPMLVRSRPTAVDMGERVELWGEFSFGDESDQSCWNVYGSLWCGPAPAKIASRVARAH